MYMHTGHWGRCSRLEYCFTISVTLHGVWMLHTTQLTHDVIFFETFRDTTRRSVSLLMARSPIWNCFSGSQVHSEIMNELLKHEMNSRISWKRSRGEVCLVSRLRTLSKWMVCLHSSPALRMTFFVQHTRRNVACFSYHPSFGRRVYCNLQCALCKISQLILSTCVWVCARRVCRKKTFSSAIINKLQIAKWLWSPVPTMFKVFEICFPLSTTSTRKYYANCTENPN